MGKLMQRHMAVRCYTDGEAKTLYYTVIQDPGGSFRPGARWGCNEPKGPGCGECWKKIKEVIKNEKDLRADPCHRSSVPGRPG